jgi:hypothetical protein
VDTTRTRKRTGRTRRKGNGSSVAGRSSSRERPRDRRSFVEPFVLRHGRGLRRIWRRKASRTAEAYALHGAPAESVLAAFELSHRYRKARFDKRGSGGGDRDVSGFSHERSSGRTSRVTRIDGRRSGERVVKRGPPRSHCIERPRASRCPVSSLRPPSRAVSGGEDGTRRDVARVSTRRKPRDESHRMDGAERRRARGGCAGRRRRAHGWSSQCFGEQKSAERIGVRPSSNASHIARGQADWLEGRNVRAVTARGALENERDGAGVGARHFHRWSETARVACAQASSGSHPEGCGLGDSGSLRAASA